MKTVSLLWVRGVLQAASLQGLKESEIIVKAGLEPDCLNVRSERISLDDTLAIWRSVEQLSEDPLFGFHMGQSLKPAHFQLLAFTMFSSPTLGNAIEKILKYQRLISDGGAFTLMPQEDNTSLVYTPIASNFSYHQIDAVLVATLSFARWLLGREIMPLKLTFTHENKGGLIQYRSFFGCDIEFNTAQNSILLTSQLLQEALPGFNQGLATVHEQMADNQLQGLMASDIIIRVQECFPLMSHGRINRDDIAAQLGMSGRSLQRKLHEQGSSFQKLHDDYRHRHSLQLLANTNLSLMDISLQLGFSESSTFHRAFKRWQGLTPGEYRHQLFD
ncbi:MAG: AraC-like DNA-binding protein [Oleispira sp.]